MPRANRKTSPEKGASQRRKKNDTPVNKRGEATVVAIIEAAEQLWGIHGLEGASLRHIGQAAGSANKAAITYHFGSKDELISAIFNHRMASLDARRRPLFDAAQAEGRLNDTYTLLSLLVRPLAEEVDRNGRRSYTHFLRALGRFDRVAARRDLSLTVYRIFELLPKSVPHVPGPVFRTRLSLVMDMCFSAVIAQDDRASKPKTNAKLLDDVLKASVYLLSMPV